MRPVDECVAAMLHLGNAFQRYSKETRESAAMADFAAIAEDQQDEIIQLMFAAGDALDEVAEALRESGRAA